MTYKSVEIKPAVPKKIDEAVNGLAREGWRLVSLIPSMEHSGATLGVLAVFERE